VEKKRKEKGKQEPEQQQQPPIAKKKSTKTTQKLDFLVIHFKIISLSVFFSLSSSIKEKEPE
jgi:hypothetical protein